VPAGWLSDRYGVRLTLALYLALWSAFTGWMGLAAGLAEAGAYPAAGCPAGPAVQGGGRLQLRHGAGLRRPPYAYPGGPSARG
jgi:hypothetical protein